MVVEGLVLILVLVEDLAKSREGPRVGGHLGDEVVKVLCGAAVVAQHVVEVGDLVDDLWRVGDDGVELLKRLQRLAEDAQHLVHQAKVVDCLHAVRLHTNGLQVQLLGLLQLVALVQAVAWWGDSGGMARPRETTRGAVLEHGSARRQSVVWGGMRGRAAPLLTSALAL